MNIIQRNTVNKDGKRVGRGGKRGKTSGRGHKGQRQHGGHGVRPEMRDVIKRFPKLRGHGKNRRKSVIGSRLMSIPVNVSTLESMFEKGATVSPSVLAEMGLVSAGQIAKRTVKILGHGGITKALTVIGCDYSSSARTKIEQAGGTCS
ncbi:MAG: large subunit ribosomal protein L15 [Planctomycetota bacterium]|jgi:large subunit ribosomal protein L15